MLHKDANINRKALPYVETNGPPAALTHLVFSWHLTEEHRSLLMMSVFYVLREVLAFYFLSANL